MLVVRDPEAYRGACAAARGRGLRVGLVPTMGALHAGHVALVAEALRRASFVAVSIFVNPTQFGPHEDLARYPRTLEADIEECERAGAAVVFAPSDSAMYPSGDQVRLRLGGVAAGLCGAHRPGHFEGVATIVAKLLGLTGPCAAVFGRKDYQQLCVIRRVVADLFLPVEVIGLPTVREPDGLAMSSRNAYLSPEQRAAARAIPRGLARAWQAFQGGAREAGELVSAARAAVEAVATSIDYVDVADPESVRVLSPAERAGDRALLAMAVRLGGARLIDNVVLGEDPSPSPAEGAAKEGGADAR